MIGILRINLPLNLFFKQKAAYEIEFDKRKVEIKEPVRQLGDYEVTVRVYPNINAKMILRVKNIQED